MNQIVSLTVFTQLSVFLWNQHLFLDFRRQWHNDNWTNTLLGVRQKIGQKKRCETITTVSDKNSQSIDNNKYCKQYGMCQKKSWVKIDMVFLLWKSRQLRFGLPCQPHQTNKDDHVKDEGNEDEDEASKDPDCQCRQPFWLWRCVGQDGGEHGHKNMKKYWFASPHLLINN